MGKLAVQYARTVLVSYSQELLSRRYSMGEAFSACMGRLGLARFGHRSAHERLGSNGSTNLAMCRRSPLRTKPKSRAYGGYLPTITVAQALLSSGAELPYPRLEPQMTLLSAHSLKTFNQQLQRRGCANATRKMCKSFKSMIFTFSSF